MKMFNVLVGCAFCILSLAVMTSPAMADEKLNSEFWVAAGMGQLERVQSLLKQGADINSRAPSAGNVPAGGTALMLAAARNHLQMVKFLISNGANVNLADEGGGTALIYAVWTGYKDLVALLLEKGADIYAKTRDGRTPLSVAKQYGHTEIEKMLKAAAKGESQGGWGDANAQTKGNVYSNKFVGLSFSFPEGWYIATDNETKDLMPDAAIVMGLDDPVAKSVVAQMPGMVLLMVSERPFTTDVQSANRNIIFVAINAREMKNEVRSGADYLGHVARGMRESQANATVSDIITQRLGGDEFHRLNVRLPMQGITVHMSQLARIHNDYIVILNMSADSDNGLTELVEIAATNMQLSAVPQAVDSSPEGESFRKQSSITPPSSSGSNPLKTIGIILMVLGALWFIKNVFLR